MDTSQGGKKEGRREPCHVLTLLALFFTVNAFLHYNFSYIYVIVNDHLNYNLFRFIAAVCSFLSSIEIPQEKRNERRQRYFFLNIYSIVIINYLSKRDNI